MALGLRQKDLRDFPSCAPVYHATLRQTLGKMMNLRHLCAALGCFILPLAAQTAKSLNLQQTHYELRMGEPVPILAASETLDFLSGAKGNVVVCGSPLADARGSVRPSEESAPVAQASGLRWQVGDLPHLGSGCANSVSRNLVVGPDKTGRIVLAASPLAKPGNYTVTLSATSAAGEQRQATMDVAVGSLTTVPSSSTRNPVVLLNGWETGFTGSCPISGSSSDTFGNLAQYLVDDGVPVVYLFDNCLVDPNQPIETLGNDLGTFLNSIQYDTGVQVPQIDLVAFSMGGLIVRSYLAGLQPSQTLTPPANTLTGKVVFIATPHFGSFVAGTYAAQLASGTQSAELIPGSSLLWNLANWNQRTDDLRGVNAIAVVGNAGTYTPSFNSTTVLNNASDGIVSLTSASVGFVTEQASVTRIVPYCHVDPSAFTNTTFGAYACNAPGIANVTSASHYTSEIVRSFLAGTTTWQSIGTTPATDPYLSANGGMFFGLVNETDSYVSDLSQVTWGTATLLNGGDISTIFYYDFIAGTGVFEATSASLGGVNCGNYALPNGYFTGVRCKFDATIVSVGPLLTTFPKVVSAGGIITITGTDFGSQCNGCKVVAVPAGSTTGQTLQISSWKSTAIMATLPSTFTGLVTIIVNAAQGSDSMAIMAAQSNPSIIAVSPASLQFSYGVGGAVPGAQSIQITNTGAGTLAWTASVSSSASWLSVSPSSGTAPSTITISVSPTGLSAGTYTGSVQIVASGASNTPLSVPVTFTITQAVASLAVAPQALTFNYAVGGAAPVAQSVTITNVGAGTLNWTASTPGSNPASNGSAYWVAASPVAGTAAPGTPGTLSVSINPANLAAGTYTASVQITAAGATGSPASIAVTLIVIGTTPTPVITAVGNGASFQPGLASATWITVVGSKLSSTTYAWQASDFVNGQLPVSLQGVSATVNGIPAFIEYISPTQINLLAPDDPTTGAVQVQVTVAQVPSNSLTVQKTAFSPAFFTIDKGLYVAAEHSNYSLVGSPNLIQGATTTPAQPGETILIYATGFGPTNPLSPTSQLVTTANPLANSVQVTIGGVTANVVFAGLVESGTYQLNVTVPSLPDGDAAVVATVGGVSTQTGVSITVANPVHTTTK